MKDEKKKNTFEINELLTILILLALIVIVFSALYLINDSKTVKNYVENKVKNKEIIKKDVVVDNELSLVMVGDSLIHGAIYQDAKEGNKYNFYKMLDVIKPVISSYDLAYYNQESLLGGVSLGLQSYPRFNSPQEVGDAFLDAGFNIVTFANNHTLDMGEKGILASLDYWDTKKAQGIMTAGSYRSFEDRDKDVIMEKNGITYTILSYTTTTNGLSRPKGKEYLVNVYDPEQVKKDVERLRNKVDLLMVAMHWGVEYTHEPVEEQKEIAAYLSSLGVDIIIGSHPHVIQPVDFIGNTMVIYSLGNFIASQGGDVSKHTGLMMSVKVHKREVNGESKITLEDPTAELEYVYSSSKTKYKLYPYDKLNDNLLKNYKKHYNYFMNIVTKNNKNILFKEL